MRSLDHGPPAPKRVTRDVVCRLCRWLCSVVSHATEQRCVVSHATEQRCVACYRAAFVTEQTCGVVSVAWRFGRLLFSLVSSVLRVCVRPYCALRSFRDDVGDDDDECPSVAILVQETSVRFSPHHQEEEHKELASNPYEINFENMMQTNQMQPCVCH